MIKKERINVRFHRPSCCYFIPFLAGDRLKSESNQKIFIFSPGCQFLLHAISFSLSFHFLVQGFISVFRARNFHSMRTAAPLGGFFFFFFVIESRITIGITTACGCDEMSRTLSNSCIFICWCSLLLDKKCCFFCLSLRDPSIAFFPPSILTLDVNW